MLLITIPTQHCLLQNLFGRDSLLTFPLFSLIIYFILLPQLHSSTSSGIDIEQWISNEPIFHKEIEKFRLHFEKFEYATNKEAKRKISKPDLKIYLTLRHQDVVEISSAISVSTEEDHGG